MPYITAETRQLEDGQYFTRYFNTADSGDKPHNFKVAQDFVRIVNRGSDDIIVTVSGTSKTIKPGREDNFQTAVGGINVRSISGIQPFMCETWSSSNGVGSGGGTGFVYNVDIGLRFWKRALARLRAGYNEWADIIVVGDSYVEGANSGIVFNNAMDIKNALSRSFVGRMRQILTARGYGDTGLGFIPIGFPAGYRLIAAASALYMWTFTGSWQSFTVGIQGDGTRGKSVLTGDTASLAFDGIGIEIVVWGTSSTFLASVDGGVDTQYTPNNTNAPQIFKISGLTAGSHTLKLTSQGTAPKPFQVIGAAPFSDTKGIRVHNFGHGGYASAQVSAINDSTKLVTDLYKPALTIIGHGGNDLQQNVNPNTYYNNLKTAVVNVKSKGGDVLLTSFVGDYPTSWGMTPTYPAGQFRDKMYQLAMEQDCAFVDIYNRWNKGGDFLLNKMNFLSPGTDVHPNDSGHYDIAAAMMNALLDPGY